MTRKQIKKLAKEIAEQELIHNNPNSSVEEKALAEKQILLLSSRIPNLGLMDEIDALVQEFIMKKGDC